MATTDFTSTAAAICEAGSKAASEAPNGESAKAMAFPGSPSEETRNFSGSSFSFTKSGFPAV